MKSYLILLILISLTIACEKEKDKTTTTSMSQIAIAAKPVTGAIPLDNELFKMSSEPSKYTWNDLDVYYRNTLLNAQPDPAIENLKKLTIMNMVDYFNLLEKADLETIEFYVNEQAKQSLVNPEVFVKCLTRLKGHWYNFQIHEVAMQKYEDARSFINQSDNPEAYWEKNQARYKAITDFASLLPIRWGE